VISYTTFQDVIDHGFDYLGGNPSDQVRRDCVRAALEARNNRCQFIFLRKIDLTPIISPGPRLQRQRRWAMVGGT
jgi:hypothetical protein